MPTCLAHRAARSSAPLDSFATRMRTIQLRGLRFSIAATEPFWGTLERGEWEPETIALLERCNGPGRRFVDIGAWMGPTTLIAAACGSECWSFEPDPVAFGKLQANVNANPEFAGRIHLFNNAVTPDGAPIRLFTRFTFGDSGSSMLSRVKDAGQSVEVASTTFDRFIGDHGIDRIDLLKMDIEGGEFLVVPTMRAALERIKPVFCVATHYPYLIEFFQKKRAPSGIQRRLGRALSRISGSDPTAAAKADAQAAFNTFAEALSGYPYIFTLRMERVAPERLFDAAQGLQELVFAHTDLAVG